MSSRPRRRAPASRRHRRTQPRRHEPHPRQLDRIAPEYDVTPNRARDRFEPHRNLHSAHSGPKPRLPHAEPDRARQDRSAGTRRLTRNRAHAPYRPHDPTPIPPSTVRTRGSPRQDGESPRTLPLERTQERNREPYGALRAHRRPLDLDQGRCRHRAARGRRNPRTGEAVSIPARTAPPFKAGKTLCGRLDGQHGERAVRWHPFGREPQPGRPRFFATHPPRRDAPDSPLPSRILRHRRPSRSHAHCATAITLPPPSGCRLPPGRGTFVAGRSRHDSVDSSLVRTYALSRADIGCLRRGNSSFRGMRIGSNDSSALECASQVPKALPRRLRRPWDGNQSTSSIPHHEALGTDTTFRSTSLQSGTFSDVPRPPARRTPMRKRIVVSTFMALFIAFSVSLESYAGATKEKCSCDLREANDNSDGAEVKNASACTLTINKSRNWCYFTVDSLTSSNRHRQHKSQYRAGYDKSNENSAETIVQFFSERFGEWLASSHALGILDSLESPYANTDNVSSRINSDLRESSRLLFFCTKTFFDESNNRSIELTQEGSFGCGVHPSGWLTLAFQFDHFDIYYLLGP